MMADKRPDWEKWINAEDSLAMLIGVHKQIGHMLSELIDEALVDEHRLELDRLSFPVRLDLAIALRLLEEPVRGALLTLNATRNSLAHGSISHLEPKHAHDLYNALDHSRLRYIAFGESEPNFDNWIEAYKMILATLCLAVESSIRRERERKVYEEAMHEEVVETIGRQRYSELQLEESPTMKRVAARFEKLKKERGLSSG